MEISRSFKTIGNTGYKIKIQTKLFGLCMECIESPFNHDCNDDCFFNNVQPKH